MASYYRRYNHLKNPAIWLVVTRLTPIYSFCKMSGTIKCFHFQPLPAKKKSKKKVETMTWDSLGQFLDPNKQNQFFEKNQILSLMALQLYVRYQKNLMNPSREKLVTREWPNDWPKNQQTNTRTNGYEFIDPADKSKNCISTKTYPYLIFINVTIQYRISSIKKPTEISHRNLRSTFKQKLLYGTSNNKSNAREGH